MFSKHATKPQNRKVNPFTPVHSQEVIGYHTVITDKSNFTETRNEGLEKRKKGKRKIRLVRHICDGILTVTLYTPPFFPTFSVPVS